MCMFILYFSLTNVNNKIKIVQLNYNPQIKNEPIMMKNGNNN